MRGSRLVAVFSIMCCAVLCNALCRAHRCGCGDGPQFAEDLDKATFATPAAYVRETARRKALEVHERIARDAAAAGAQVAGAGASAGDAAGAGSGTRPAVARGPVLIISADTIVVRG